MKEPIMVNGACRFWDAEKKECKILRVDNKTGCYKGNRCPFKKLHRNYIEAGRKEDMKS